MILRSAFPRKHLLKLYDYFSLSLSYRKFAARILPHPTTSGAPSRREPCCWDLATSEEDRLSKSCISRLGSTYSKIPTSYEVGTVLISYLYLIVVISNYYNIKLYVVEINELLKSFVLSLCSSLYLCEEFLCSLGVAKRREGIE